jgi:hypothetical protein
MEHILMVLLAKINQIAAFWNALAVELLRFIRGGK